MQSCKLPQSQYVVKLIKLAEGCVLGGDEVHWKPWRSGYKSLLNDF